MYKSRIQLVLVNQYPNKKISGLSFTIVISYHTQLKGVGTNVLPKGNLRVEKSGTKTDCN
jgi:hypothetical protein